MITIRKNYNELKQISEEKGVEIFLGNETSSYYQLLLFYNEVLYETFILKNSSQEYTDFLQNDFANLSNKKNYNPEWDTILISFPSDTEELHTYLMSNIPVQFVRTIYENNSKRQIIRVEKSVI